MNIKSIILAGLTGLAVAGATTSCSDFFEQDSNSVIFADQEHLNSAADTVYSVIGIMNKLQAIADRTILLGEARGDLVDVNSYTEADLRNLALFNVNDSNEYNDPKDYYAIINNCNYFLAHADTAMKNSQNQAIFEREYAAVKAFRAWTYLQLVLNYGRVPFVTEPILTETQAEAEYPMYEINDVCDYFINDLLPYVNAAYPGYLSIGSRVSDSRLLYFPVYMLLGELNLWRGNYRAAAENYYKFISNRNGSNSLCPIAGNSSGTGTSDQYTAYWRPGTENFMSGMTSGAYEIYFSNETWSGELVSMIAGDSILAEGNYSLLRSIFNFDDEELTNPQLNPSQSLIDLSASQTYCMRSDNGNISYVLYDIDDYGSGDLRLNAVLTTGTYQINSTQYDYQNISKYSSQHVHIYRKREAYLRMAEAFNRAGFPQAAFMILETGITNNEIDSLVKVYPNDSIWLSQFDFPTTRYITRKGHETSDNYNTIGIHSFGSGYTEGNEYYVFPDDSTITDATARLNYQIEKVEDMIVDEGALEFSFEGKRFYDLMRVALRRNDPSYLADRVYARKGWDNVATMKSLIQKDLTDKTNWYLNWGGKIGY